MASLRSALGGVSPVEAATTRRRLLFRPKSEGNRYPIPNTPPPRRTSTRRRRQAADILQPVRDIPDAPPTQRYTVDSYRLDLPSSTVVQANSRAHAGHPSTITDMPHREYVLPAAATSVRVSIPVGLEDTEYDSRLSAAEVRSSVDHCYTETMGITCHMHTENRFFSEFGPLPDRHSNAVDLRTHCTDPTATVPTHLAAERDALRESMLFGSTSSRFRDSVAVQASTVAGGDYVSNFRHRHAIDAADAKDMEHRVSKDPRKGLRWCTNCGQCSGRTCHLVTQLNHFRKGLDVLEAIRRHRNAFLARDPADHTVRTEDLPLPFQALQQ